MRTGLKGNIVHLRAMEPEDVELLYHWENDPGIWHLSSTFAPYSKHLIRQFALSDNDIFTNKQLRLIICCQDNRPVGAIDLFDFSAPHKRAGIGILIAEESDRRNGYGSEALDLLIRYAFDILQLHQLYCNVLTDNEESIKLFSNKGFELVGTKKEWVNVNNNWKDEHILQLLSSQRNGHDR